VTPGVEARRGRWVVVTGVAALVAAVISVKQAQSDC